MMPMRRRSTSAPAPARQRGAALLAAMLTVALVATFAAAALWQQWRSVEVETAERARVQAAWILTGGLDWARLVLREDAKGSTVDSLGEPWAVPLQEARLSSFLAAQNNVSTSSDDDTGVMDAFLSGQMVDLQSMMNVTNLVRNGSISDRDLQNFGRLFNLLGLPQAQLDKLAENLRFALDTSATNGSSPLAPLVPQRLDDLAWLGVTDATITALRPYVTILPLATPINLNTASAEVIQATIGLSAADAQRLVAVRANAPFHQPADAAAAIGVDPALFSPPAGTSNPMAATATSFFEVRSRLRLDKLVVEEHSIVQRIGIGIDVKVLQRWRTAPTPDATAGADTPGAGAADMSMR
jgi:general secretion pathway protein K